MEVLPDRSVRISSTARRWAPVGEKGSGAQKGAGSSRCMGAPVGAVPRRGLRALAAGVEPRIEAGDVVVLLGGPTGLEAAEQRLLGG